MADAVHELLATDVALDTLGARGISAQEAEQLPTQPPRDDAQSGRARRAWPTPAPDRPHRRRSRLTLVIVQTVEPTTWLIITGWDSTDAERKILESATP